MRKFISILVAVALVFAAFPKVALALGSGTISAGGSYNLADYGSGSVITIDTTEPVTLTGDSSTTYTDIKIVGAVGGVALTINNVRIDDSQVSLGCPLSFTGAGNKLALTGASFLTAGSYKPAVRVISGVALTISGSGSITATGGFGGAAIGSSGGNGSSDDCGTITIAGGTIIATGSYYAAAIGGSMSGCGTVNITGGNVTATGGDNSAAIGGGAGGTVNITGGVVKATGGTDSAAIGSGWRNGASYITIDHATVTAVGIGGAAIGGGNVIGDYTNFGTILINSSTVTATCQANGASSAIGGGPGNSGGSVTISQTDPDWPCVVFASGDTSFGANDVGNGYSCSGTTLTLKDDATVFLRHDSCVTPTSTGSQTHCSGLTAINGMYHGVLLPDGWDTGFGAYLGQSLTTLKLTIDANGGPGQTVERDVMKNVSFILPSASGYNDGANKLVEWNTNADGTGDAYAPGVAVRITKDTTFYAIRAVVHVTGVQLSNTSLSFTMGSAQTAQLTATVSPDDTSYPDAVWASDNPSVATVDSTGVVTAIKGGQATITATADGKSGSCQVTVLQPVTGLSLNKTGIAMSAGTTKALIATVAPADATNKTVAWSSDDPSVATVDSTGVVTAVKNGTAVITAAAGGKSAACRVTVGQLVTDISLDALSLTLAVGGSGTLKATVSPNDADDPEVTWASSNTSVATVDQTGEVKAVKAGMASITASSGSVTAACLVTVTQPVTGLSLDQTSLTLPVGAKEELTGKVAPVNATDKSVAWSSDTPTVATVSQSGVVAAVKAGTAVITAASGGKTATCSVTVKRPVTAIMLDSSSFTLTVETKKTLKATVSPTDAYDMTVTWASANSAVATVDQAGVVTAVKAGSAVVTASAGTVTATCIVTVKQPVSGISLNSLSLTLAVGARGALTATVTPSNASDKTVAWSSSTPTVATVDQNGMIVAKSVGRTVITATAGGLQATCEVFVSSVALNLKLTVGGTVSLSAAVGAGNGSAAAKWTSSNLTVASVNSSGLVTARKEGSAVVTVTAGGVSQSVGILVGAPVSIAAPASVKAVSNAYNSVTLSWSASANATGYEVWRVASSTGAYKLVATVSTTVYTDTNLATGTAYYYKVLAYYSGSVRVTSAYSSVVSAKPVPAAPASPMAASASPTSIKVSWAAVAGVAKYELWRCNSATGEYTLVTATTALNFTNTQLTTAKTYYFKVRAYRLVNGKNVYGAFSAVVSAKP